MGAPRAWGSSGSHRRAPTAVRDYPAPGSSNKEPWLDSVGVLRGTRAPEVFGVRHRRSALSVAGDSMGPRNEPHQPRASMATVRAERVRAAAWCPARHRHGTQLELLDRRPGSGESTELQPAMLPACTRRTVRTRLHREPQPEPTAREQPKRRMPSVMPTQPTPHPVRPHRHPPPVQPHPRLTGYGCALCSAWSSHG